MSTISCARCNHEGEALAKPPMPGALGEEVQKRICQPCWQEWMGMSVKIINEYRLQLFRPEHRKTLEDQMKLFLNLLDQTSPAA